MQLVVILYRCYGLPGQPAAWRFLRLRFVPAAGPVAPVAPVAPAGPSTPGYPGNVYKLNSGLINVVVYDQ